MLCGQLYTVHYRCSCDGRTPNRLNAIPSLGFPEETGENSLMNTRMNICRESWRRRWEHTSEIRWTPRLSHGLESEILCSPSVLFRRRCHPHARAQSQPSSFLISPRLYSTLSWFLARTTVEGVFELDSKLHASNLGISFQLILFCFDLLFCTKKTVHSSGYLLGSC